MGSAFTYQGRLTDHRDPVNGICDMRFDLYDAATSGTLLGTDTEIGVPVSEGYFSVLLNDAGEFGSAAFTGNARWLQIAVDCCGTGCYSPPLRAVASGGGRRIAGLGTHGASDTSRESQ